MVCFVPSTGGNRQEDTVAPEPTSSSARESHFSVGTHLVRLSCSRGRWSVHVDSAAFAQWYTTEAEAWEAGVREADRLDRSGGT
jgi:hypothetical protein